MPFDGAGNFTRDPTTRIANQGALVSAQVNTETDNAVVGINGKVNLDGKLTHTGLQTLFGDGTAVAHPTTVRQVQQGIVSKASAVGGTVDAITITMSPASVAYVTKETFEWISGGANTSTTPTINKDGLGAKTIVSATGGALVAGATGVSGVLNRGYYDGTNVRLLSSSFIGGTATTALIMSGKDFREAKSAAVASAGTTDIWTPADGNYVHVTGTTTITSLGTAHQAGEERTVIFDGSLTLTHNGTSLILPGATSIPTAAGDRMIVRADTTANMNVIGYFPASGKAVIATASGETIIDKGSDTGYSSAVLASDPALVVPVSANTNYLIRLRVGFTTSASTVGIAVGITTPAAPTSVAFEAMAPFGAGTYAQTVATFATSTTSSATWTQTVSTETGGSLWVEVRIKNGANAGNVTFQFARQGGAGTMTVKTSSWVSYQAN